MSDIQFCSSRGQVIHAYKSLCPKACTTQMSNSWCHSLDLDMFQSWKGMQGLACHHACMGRYSQPCSIAYSPWLFLTSSTSQGVVLCPWCDHSSTNSSCCKASIRHPVALYVTSSGQHLCVSTYYVTSLSCRQIMWQIFVVQAYYVIKAAQEREELQREGDALDARIQTAEKEVRGLEATLAKLNLVNTDMGRSFRYWELANIKTPRSCNDDLEIFCSITVFRLWHQLVRSAALLYAKKAFACVWRNFCSGTYHRLVSCA